MKKYFSSMRIGVSLGLIIIIAIGIFFYVKSKNADDSSENLEKDEQSQEIQLNCQEIIKDVVEKISEISPTKPVLGGDWHVNRFWFIKDSNENFYVEYEDGHNLRRVLLCAEKKGNELNYKVIGYFEPGETTWALKKGEDPFFDKELDLYEYNNEFSQWLKKN